MTPHRSFSSAEGLGHREPTSGATADLLEHRIAALRAEVAAAEQKRHGIDEAIKSRRKALQRLLAQLAMCESGTAPKMNE